MSNFPGSISNPRENDIFISYAEADIQFAKKLDTAIRRQGRDPWIDWEDIPFTTQSKVEHQQCIEAGIKDADIFVFIISQDSLQSGQKKVELELANHYQKRVVPVLWKPLSGHEFIPEILQNNSWVRLEQDTFLDDGFDYLAKKIIDIQIYTRLSRHAGHWKHENYSNHLLLSGKDLAAVKQWLAQTKTEELQLTPLQKTYTEASFAAQSKVPEPTDAFISYSRTNRDFVEKLYFELKGNNLNPWVDWENIPVAADWWQEIEEGIEASHTFIFIISPASITSKYCHAEIAYAIKHGKRLIPVEWHKVPDELWQKTFDSHDEIYIQGRPITSEQNQKITLKEIEEKIKRYQWKSFVGEDFTSSFKTLLRAIATDLDHVKTHTRLLLRAVEWDNQKRSEEYLLRRGELRTAKQWVFKSYGKDPSPTELQEQYVAASSKAISTRRFNNFLLALLLGSIVSGLAAFSLITARAEIRALVASLENRQELDALMTGLQIGRKLKRYNWVIDWLDPSLRVRGITALQQESYNLRELNRLELHQGQIYNVAFSPDGKFLASASEDKSVILWNRDGTMIRTLKGHQADVVSVVFNSDGQTLASAGYDSSIKIWTIEGNLKRTIDQAHQASIISVSFDPGGTLLASASTDGTVKLWTAEGNPVSTLPHIGVTGLSFNRYGDRLVTASADGSVKLWTRSGEQLKTLEHGSPVYSVSFSPDGQVIASAGADGQVKLWNQDGTPIATLEGHQDIVYRVAFSPNSQVLASASKDGTVRLWRRDGKPWKDSGKYDLVLRGHQDSVFRVQFSPDNRTLASAGADDTVKLWSISYGTSLGQSTDDEPAVLIDSLEGHRDEVLSIDFSKGGDNGDSRANRDSRANELILASASKDRTIRLWKLSSQVQRLPHQNRIFDSRFSPTPVGKDTRLLAASGLRSITIWRQNFKSQEVTLLTKQTIDTARNVWSVDFSPNNQMLVSGSEDGVIRLWALRNGGTELAELASVENSEPNQRGPNQREDVFSVRFHPTQPIVASVGGDGILRLWTIENKKLIFLTSSENQTTDVNGAMHSVAFSPDGRFIAVAGENGFAGLWELNSDGSQLTWLDSFPQNPGGHQGKVLSITFNPNTQNGHILATAGEDATVKLWKMHGSQVTFLKNLEGHDTQVLSVNFSPDGKLLASASRDKTIRLWTSQGTPITTLSRHRREVSSVSFSPLDGKTLASASYDNNVFLWQLPARFDEGVLKELLENGCTMVKDYLSAAEDENTNQEIQDLKSYCEKLPQNE